MFKKINDLWFRLIGDGNAFSLESRIFHSISIALIFVTAFYIPYDFFAGLYVAALSSLFFAGFFFYQYYNSRVRGKPHSNLLFGLLGLVILSVNYFANSGINGSTDLVWPAYLLLVFAISPYRQHLAWLLVYLATFLILHLVAYYYPQLVKYPFSAGMGQLTDRITAFPLPVIVIYIVIKFIRRNYDKEKTTAEEKATAVETQNQQILKQKRLLEESNAEKDKLMSIISHDMRAPLVGIKGYLELLKGVDLDDHQSRSLQKELLEATNSTMDMLTNLLQWSKSQMEGPTITTLPVNLFATLKGTLEMGKAQAARKNITLGYHIDDQIDVLADTDMLQLVVRNLVSNAIKFTPPGGIINIDARMIQHECKITVSDNGKGIDKHKQEKIFSINTEPGFGTNNEKGVGLGLLLCKEFIERQGGRIGFESTFGRGSSFFIFIPPHDKTP
ncbi:sensor histidine kinase [Mucilaginibacter segetis]|uniref:histidine kinase n=1 Tax=Mucilaginibacter segetis TaxID=2793071 RepID=A0A934PRY2_9SPHI|nr:HAMP domain-containing sensor histidine kinase [Mucilaginibacter segetis]MBK0379683.1 sensor histidine kinase [Mucilaginibacter segetis]